MMTKRIGSAVVTLLFVVSIFSQSLHDAPSLQVGLSGISFQKGNLDAALVAEIVAEKQQEVKVKLIKNMLLQKIGVDNGLFYAYIDQAINILTTEKDEETRIKNLLENTVNLAFVVGYTDYYVSTLRKGSDEWNTIRRLAISYGVDRKLFDQPRISLKDFAVLGDNRSDGNRVILENNFPIDQKLEFAAQRNQFVGVLIDLFSESIRQNDQLKALGVLRTNYLQNNLSMNAYLDLANNRNFKDPTIDKLIADYVYALEDEERREARELIESITISLRKKTALTLSTEQRKLLDEYKVELTGLQSRFATIDLSKLDAITQQNIAQSKKIIELKGSFEKYIESTHNIPLTEIKAMGDNALNNQYSYVQWYLDTQFTLAFFSRRKLANTLFEQAGNNLDIYIKYYGLIKSLKERGSDWKETLAKLSTNYEDRDTDVLYSNMLVSYQNGRKAITDLSKLSTDELADLDKVHSFMEKLKFVNLKKFEYLQIYEREIKPALSRLSRHSFDFMISGAHMLNMLTEVGDQVKKDLELVNLDINFSFLKIFTELDEFEKVGTYADFLNYLSDAGDVFSDSEMRKSINMVITFIRSYIKVEQDQGQTVLNLDVEGFIQALQNLPYNHYRPLQFHFTVGTNTVFFQDNLQLNDTVSIRNYSFVGEKIGVKLKLADLKYLRSFSKGETYTYYGRSYLKTAPPSDPMISNLHLLLYGSGILYNLVNTGTTQDFNAPLIGIGAGLTFFNDLDLNVSWGKPIMADKAFFDSSVPTFFNVGFDIQFAEYISRLQDKRQRNKTVKRLSQSEAASDK